MMAVLKQKTLDHWFDLTMETKTLVAPREVAGVLLYRPITRKIQMAQDYIRPVLSAKETLFPPTERILTIEKTGQTIHLTEALPEGEQVIFGIRPCDARAIAAMDALFIESDPVDLNYARRRENTTIIGVACETMGDTCFCTSTGGALDDPTGMDILLKETNDGFEVYAITEKGKKIAQNDWGIKNCEVNRPEPSLSENPQFNIPDENKWPSQFNDDFWMRLAERCLSCRICAYVCPTCRCFDVRDEAVPSGNGHQTFERIRCWDSCAGEAYRKIAGGHNPRAEKGQRLRNRFFCKFYYYPEQYGPMGCTGCGRCVDSCPVNIDITEVINHVTAHRMEVSA